MLILGRSAYIFRNWRWPRYSGGTSSSYTNPGSAVTYVALSRGQGLQRRERRDAALRSAG